MSVTQDNMKKKSNSILGMSFFGPALVLMTVFLFIPMILTLIYSFTDYFALNPKLTHFIGLENFKNIFKDDLFTTAFGNTIKFVLIIVPLQTLGALGLALLINKVTVCKKYFKVAFFIPVVMSLAVVSNLWMQIYIKYTIIHKVKTIITFFRFIKEYIGNICIQIRYIFHILYTVNHIIRRSANTCTNF